MTEDPIKLGDVHSSEKLISDLYIDLRRRVNTWAAITQQTSQARMGYVGQHLTSVVTGFPGGKSGAGGRDIVLPDGEYAEIKSCYRVDQLGQCNNCDARIASVELECPDCGSGDIKRNDDSKWLIGIRHDDEFSQTLEPKAYYLVLFEFVDIQSPNAIRSSIWEVDPKLPGFAYCMVDYRLNIQAKSQSRAPFNLWPYQLKFDLMRPNLIYRSIISTVSDSVDTVLFPGRDAARVRPINPLGKYARARNLTADKIELLADALGVPDAPPRARKRERLDFIQNHIETTGVSRETVADALATSLYANDIERHVPTLPEPLRGRIESLMDLD